MRQLPCTYKRISILLIWMAVSGFSVSICAQALSSAEAAELARKQSGGKVLKVKDYDQKKQGYTVRVLTKGGQVRELFIPNKK